MKKKCILLFILFIQLFALFSRELDLNWLTAKKTIRSTYNPMQKKQFDSNLMNILEKNDLAPEIESNLSEMLYQIMLDNDKIAPEISFIALSILQKRVQDKKYFYFIASDIAFHHTQEYPQLISYIIKGMTEMLLIDTQQNFKTMKSLFSSIKNHYIFTAKNGDIKYGSELIITELIAYIREYLRYLNEGKIQITQENNQIIRLMYEDLALEKGNFMNLSGAKELVMEY